MRWYERIQVTIGAIGLVTLLLSCATASREPVKISKPSPAIKYDPVFETAFWKCDPFGFDAHTKKQVWLCTFKSNGARYLVIPQTSD